MLIAIRPGKGEVSMNKLAVIFLILCCAILFASCGKQKKQEQIEQKIDTTYQQADTEKEPQYALTAAGNPIVMLSTTKGNIELEVFEKESPNHAGNFIKLVKSGYYDGLNFHHVIPDIVIESGDPSGSGALGPGYDLEPEKTPYSNQAGFVGMMPLENGKSNGSQFYILVKDNPDMDEKTSCFARVIGGMEIVDEISKVPAKKEKPIETVKILEASLKQVQPPGDSTSMESTITSTTK